MMSRLLSVLVIVLSAIALQSCAVENEDTFKITGITAYRSDALDFMGFHYIKGDNGKEYYPKNLPEEFQQVGLRIRFEAREVENRTPIAGWAHGPVIEIVHIQKISS
jgi:hypothetical protein